MTLRSRTVRAAALLCIAELLLATFPAQSASRQAAEKGEIAAAGEAASAAAEVEGRNAPAAQSTDDCAVPDDHASPARLNDLPAAGTPPAASLPIAQATVVCALGLDVTTRRELRQLLLSQQSERMQRLHGREARAGEERLQAAAAAESRHLEALRQLLGREILERYQDYLETWSARTEVEAFDAGLAPADRLEPAQKARLVALFHEEIEQFHERARRSTLSRLVEPMPTAQLSAAEIGRRARLQMIAQNEQSLRDKQQSTQRMAQRAPEFLTQPQVAALSRRNAARTGNLQRQIEQARQQAGLSPSIPAQPDLPPAALQALRPQAAGRLQLELTVQVDGNAPLRITRVVANGEPFLFEVADGLLVEAVPTLYEDRWLTVGTIYYEQGRAGKRRLLDVRGSAARLEPSSRMASVEDSGAVIVGRDHGYAIKISTVAQQM